MKSTLSRYNGRCCVKDSQFWQIYRDKEFNRKLCPLQQKQKRTQREWRGSTSSSMKTEGTCLSKNFNETASIQSQKRVNTRGERRETTEEKWRSARIQKVKELRGRQQWSDKQSSEIRAPSVFSTAVGAKGKRTKWQGRQHNGSSWRKEVGLQGDCWQDDRKEQSQNWIFTDTLVNSKEQFVWFWKTTLAHLSQKKILEQGGSSDEVRLRMRAGGQSQKPWKRIFVT